MATTETRKLAAIMFTDMVGFSRGKEPRGVRGSGVVSRVPRAGKDADCYPLASRVYAPDGAGKTKNEHCPAMFVNAVDPQRLQARTSLFAGGDAAAANWTLRHQRQWPCVTTLKSKRWVSLGKEHGSIPLEDSEGTSDRLAHGGIGKLQAVPCKVRLCKLVAPDGALDWVLTNALAETVTAQVAEDASEVRWQVAALPRGLTQLTGSERCQGRAARAQRNPLACCSHAGISLKVKAKALGQTRYELRDSLFSHYLRAELRNPPIMACSPC